METSRFATTSFFTARHYRVAVASAFTAASLLLFIASQISPPFSQIPFPLKQNSNSSTEQVPEEPSCLSRHHRHMTSSSSSTQSPYLRSMLRDYEQRHKRCEPFSEPFNRASLALVNNSSSHISNCKYVIFTPANGLGNTILSLSAAFLYSLLTNRTLLVHFKYGEADLFCEPFRNTTWVLPPRHDFPFLDRIYTSQFRTTYSFGNFLKNNNKKKREHLLNASSVLLQLYLPHGHDEFDELFYKPGYQELLHDVPWLVLKTDQYFVPYLFLMPCFGKQLGELFPDRESVFHLLGNYLFNPSNRAWGLINRFYDAYLARADTRIGLQIRVSSPESSPIPLVSKQLLRCVQEDARILPRLQQNDETNSTTSRRNSTEAVLVASLSGEFYAGLKEMYWTRATAGGEVVAIYQTSHEETQQSMVRSHNLKAFVDMYLLSLCDVLVTSGWSTFGYVAQSLGGVRPWILQIPQTSNEHITAREPACRRAVSIEPCFHFPPDYESSKGQTDDHLPIVHCEDAELGIKLINVRN